MISAASSDAALPTGVAKVPLEADLKRLIQERRVERCFELVAAEQRQLNVERGALEAEDRDSRARVEPVVDGIDDVGEVVHSGERLDLGNKVREHQLQFVLELLVGAVAVIRDGRREQGSGANTRERKRWPEIALVVNLEPRAKRGYCCRPQQTPSSSIQPTHVA